MSLVMETQQSTDQTMWLVKTVRKVLTSYSPTGLSHNNSRIQTNTLIE